MPEIDTEKRQEELLEIQDIQEREAQKKKEVEAVVADKEYIYDLDNAFKTIEVMGQILKNYPGTIKRTMKNDLLDVVYMMVQENVDIPIREMSVNENAFALDKTKVLELPKIVIK